MPRKLKLPDVEWVAADVEASGLYPDDGARISSVGVAWGAAETERLVLPFGQGPESDGCLWEMSDDAGEDVWHELCDWLRGRRIAFHNGQYDVTMFGAGCRAGWAGVDLLDAWQWDSWLVSRHLDGAEGSHGLDAVGRRLGMGGKADGELRRYLGPKTDPRYDRVPWGVMREYLEQDAALGWAVLQSQRERVADGEGFEGQIERLLTVAKQAVIMERRGMPYAVQESLEAASEVEKRRVKIAGSLPFTPKAEDAKRYFFTTEKTARGVDGLGLSPWSVSDKTGKPTLDAVAVRMLAESGETGAREWYAHEFYKRVKAMYYDGWAEKTGVDGRLRARIRTQGTKSSRFSIERANMQAMPHDGKIDAELMRGLDTPRGLIALQCQKEGLAWSEFDLMQAELRVGALYARCDAMIGAFIEGVDLHQLTADLIGVDRQVGKMSNFLLLFGGGAATFQTQVKKQAWRDLSLGECREIVSGWRSEYPQFCGRGGDGGMVAYWESRARREGYVPLSGGAVRWFTPQEKQFGDWRKAWNQRVQGSIAQMYLDWLLGSEEEMRRIGLKSEIVMSVHDSIQVVGPPREYDLVSAVVCEVAAREWKRHFPGMPGGADGKRIC